MAKTIIMEEVFNPGNFSVGSIKFKVSKWIKDIEVLIEQAN